MLILILHIIARPWISRFGGAATSRIASTGMDLWTRIATQAKLFSLSTNPA